MNECSSNPCQNGASCFDGVDFYHCVCASGWQGDRCTEGEEITEYFAHAPKHMGVAVLTLIEMQANIQQSSNYKK